MSQTLTQLKDKVKTLPRKPGVYKFLNQKGQVLYVGKAKNLRSRVNQYFGTSDTRAQLPFLMAEAFDIDYTVVNTELESLFLENTLIKQYLPPYNIMLRDDKNFAFIKIDYSTPIPQISYARKLNSKPSSNNKFFGPFTSVKKIRKTLDFIRKIFPFCDHTQVGNRPCFYYHLHRCPGVCIGEVSLQEYQQQIEKISLFLSGKASKITSQLNLAMKKAARLKQFEKAARLRDQLQALNALEEKQISIFSKPVNWDFVSLYIDDNQAAVNLFKVRRGKLRDKENFIYDNLSKLSAAQDRSQIAQTITQSIVETYYSQTSDCPKELMLQYQLKDQSLVTALFSKQFGKKVLIKQPERGQKLELIKLGAVNAQNYLAKWRQSQATHADLLIQASQELQQILKLQNPLNRIECYDISNTQGTNPVGSMVVTINGSPAKTEYKKFKIRGKASPDDFAMMQEMLERRLTREKNKTNVIPQNQKDGWPTPDLLVIDGGKGQLGVAVKVLKKLQLDIPVIGLAKRIEEIFIPAKSTPIILPHNNPALQLLQRLRDEAHRFGITFHRNLRSKQAIKSALDDIPGIGPKTKKLLKQKIGTVEQIRQAPIQDLEKLIGPAKAKVLRASLT
ncbi:MAG: excinuclease ABC subunit UvrC [Candidatus Doudnabacteria bacterium]